MSSFFDAKLPTKVVKCTINVQPILAGELPKSENIVYKDVVKKWLDNLTHFGNIEFSLELVAADHLDCKYIFLVSSTKKEMMKASASYERWNKNYTLVMYTCSFTVPEAFGEIGAILVQNEHHKEAYVKNIFLDDGNITFTCESWIHSKDDNPSARIFFTNKSYLPSQTPTGLKSLREEDLKSLRGNDQGERKSFERVYDYDTYNDLGDPDASSDLARSVLGGQKHPYPSRCRTGRERTSKDCCSESRKTLPFYVPRDEEFSDTKIVTFGARKLSELLSDLSELYSTMMEFLPSFLKKASEVASKLYELVSAANGNAGPTVLLRLINDVRSCTKTVVQMLTNRAEKKEPYSWHRDEEFCRQTLAGLNPYSIQLVTGWPLMSTLDPEVYGPAESAITKEIVEQEIYKQDNKGFMTLDEALEQKKMFMLDYHDLLLPYVNKVRELEGTTLYGSRTLMFLTSEGILRPIAIELTRPPNNGKPQWKHVYIPSSEDRDATNAWLWKLAKAHVIAHDSGYHQLVSHWLRTHCVTEPYIIATHRCLSKMHPIHRLLSPHFRYTMKINSLARAFLINAGGIIESNFSPGKYSMQLCSDAYKQWRFDREALPADLISRGMGVEDPSAPSGIKLAIEDYPFANDALILWDAIKQWATTYVNHYYTQADLVGSDEELQAWWTEIRTVGHGDKKVGWPELNSQGDLIRIVTTIMWVASGHHSAVNFGQYTASYHPGRPTIARTKMPNEDPTAEEWEAFLENPEDALDNCLPSKNQIEEVASTLDALSSHSPDEEYIGSKMEAAWEADPVIRTAFEVFSKSLKKLENDIDSMNNNPNLRNRVGNGSVRYELLKPFSEPGVTGKGVPYSISI
ncbi:hypothetical protein OSB04_010314 [Centaurea solstitialis]|uniref:Lipoxygenase n=1 Tax=Centaurea solstitialis TaxID=347529 RepID=A0AA38TJ36_9ASTR|nr:hypothetical protein OSB04_010314 [Centaurea solstitialis]